MNYDHITEGTGCGAAVRQMQVSEQAGELVGALDRFEKTVHALEEKLSSVLRSEGSMAEAPVKNAIPEPSLVPLADGLRCRNRQITMLHNRLRGIIERIEL